MDDLKDLQKEVREKFMEMMRKQINMDACMEELTCQREKTEDNDFRRWNYVAAALVIFAGYRALAIEDDKVTAKISISSGCDYMDGTLTINGDEEHKTFVAVPCFGDEIDERDAEYLLRDSLQAPALTAQGHEVRYCSISYYYWDGYNCPDGIVDELTYEEAKGCSYDFLYHEDKPEEIHSIRIETMQLFYDYKREHEGFFVFNVLINQIINNIYDSSERGNCVDIEEINKQLESAMEFLKAEKLTLKEQGKIKK